MRRTTPSGHPPPGSWAGPGGPALVRLREMRRRGRASPRDFGLLLEALQELGRGKSLACNGAATMDLHVVFALPGGGSPSCFLLRGGRVACHSGPETRATRVTLPPAAAVRALTDHPARVFIEAYMSGEAEVEGEVCQLMCFIGLLESLEPHLRPRANGGATAPRRPLRGRPKGAERQAPASATGLPSSATHRQSTRARGP